jgi:hypothetical protein
MTYFYVLTFFGGFLAICGQLEMDGRHCLTLKKVEPNADPGSQIVLTRRHSNSTPPFRNTVGGLKIDSHIL